MGDARPIGVFDSGVGGLSVLRHLVHALPNENVVYIADQAHVPYGEQSAATIQAYAQAISQILLAHDCKLIVVACNTATAAAIHALRALYPHIPFVGMEPAVKPGALATRTGVVGILATAGTFESQKYAALMERYASDVTVLQNSCAGLVALIEAGDLVAARPLLARVLRPMLAAGVDTLVLGCTHYPFVRDIIVELAGAGVTIIDPAPAVVRQVRRVLANRGLLAAGSHTGQLVLLTTGQPEQLFEQTLMLLGCNKPVEQAQTVMVC